MMLVRMVTPWDSNNGKLRSAELLLHKDGSVTQIRRAETYDDLFGTLDFSNL